jgi:threonine/homoserine/homoserine lactone efflux protein
VVDLAVLPSFLVAVVLITIAPGPDNAYIAAVAVHRGPRAGLLSAIGMALGMVVHVTVAALGLALLLGSAPVALTIVRVAGAVFLGWLAFTTLRSVKRSGSAPQPPPTDRRLLARAVLTNVTNPKVILFFAAFLPQFVRPGHGPTAVQMLTLGVLFLLVGLAIDSAVGLLAGRLRDALAPGGRAAMALGVVAGLTFATLSATLSLEALRA